VRRSGRPGQRGRRSRARRTWSWAALGVSVALAALLATALLRARGSTRGPRAGTGATDARAIQDSLQAADARRDWVKALVWAERLGRIRPRDPSVLLARGTAWSNYAVDQRPGRTVPRPALRTSLERIESLRRAAGLMDSSARFAREPSRWLDSGLRLADLYETLGLPGDALIAHETMKQRLPDAEAPALRAYWLRALFYDPIRPDTSEYHERMRSLGLR